MIAAANPILDVVCVVLGIYWLILIVRVILSWAEVVGFRAPLSGPLRAAIDLLYDVTEPVLRPLRNMIPPVRAGGVGLDLSIIILFVALTVLRGALRC